jgi:hypothetical protein
VDVRLDIAKGVIVPTAPLHEATTPDGARAVVVDATSGLQVFSTASMNREWHVSVPPDARGLLVDDEVAVVLHESSEHVYDLKNGKLLFEHESPKTIFLQALLLHEHLVVRDEQGVTVFDARDGRIRAKSSTLASRLRPQPLRPAAWLTADPHGSGPCLEGGGAWPLLTVGCYDLDLHARWTTSIVAEASAMGSAKWGPNPVPIVFASAPDACDVVLANDMSGSIKAGWPRAVTVHLADGSVVESPGPGSDVWDDAPTSVDAGSTSAATTCNHPRIANSTQTISDGAFRFENGSMFDARTGKLLWKSERPPVVSYTELIDDELLLVGSTGTAGVLEGLATIYRARDGKVLYSDRRAR